MAQLNDTDSLLVNRSGKSYQIEAQNLMAELLDDDLMLVNRSGKSYKASGAEIKDSLGPKGIPNKPSIISPADGAGVPIGAVSDEITNVEYIAGPTYSSTVTASSGYNTNRGPDKGFDGNTQATGGATYCQASATNQWVQWNASSLNINTATTPVVVWGISNSDQITATGSTGTQTFAATNNTTGNGVPNVGVLQTLKFQNSGGVAGFSGISVNGSLLIDSQVNPKLTFASNKDLTGATAFETGDDIVQDSGYTPTTSAISSIDSATGTYNPNPNTSSITGISAFYSSPVTSGSIRLDNNDNLSTCLVFDGNIPGVEVVEIYYDGYNKLRYTINDGPEQEAGVTNTQAGWYPLEFSGTLTKINLSVKTASSSASGIRVNGVELDSTGTGTFGTALTFNDDTDFDNLRAGDPVTQTFNGPANAGPWPSGFRDSNMSGSAGVSSWDSCEPVTVTSGDSWRILDGGKYHVLAIDTEALGDYEITFRRTAGTTLVIHTTDDPSESWNTADAYWQNNSSTPFVLSSTEANRTPANLGGTYKRYWLFYATGSADCTFSITGTAQSAPSGTIVSIEKNTNQLIVDNASFATGFPLVGPTTTPATGTVNSVDPNAKTMSLAVSDETYPKRWIVNRSKYVKGEETPSKDAAPDAEGLTLISSDFASTPPGSIGQTGASWQVTAYDDIGFSSPVAQNLESTSDLTEWEVVPELEEDTKYRCRVRHISADQESEWSDASTFSTAGGGIPVTSKPGFGYHFQAQSSVNGVFTQATAGSGNVLVQNLAGTYNKKIIYLGIDGLAYEAPTPSSTSATLKTEYGTNLVSIWHNYENNGTGWLSCSSDGTLIGKTGSGVAGPVSYPAGYTARRILGGGGVTYPCIVELVKDSSGETKFYGFNTVNINASYGGVGTYKFNSVSAANYQLEDLGFPDVLPDGGTIVDIAGVTGNYSMSVCLVLSSTGKLYVSGTTPDSSTRYGGFPTTGTNAVPVEVDTGGTLFRHIGALGASYYANGGVCGVTVDNRLWIAGAGTNYVDSSFNNTFKEFNTTFDVADIGLAVYNSQYFMLLSTEGKLYYSGTKTGYVPVELSLPTPPAGYEWDTENWTTFGGVPTNTNVSSQYDLNLIIPTK